MPSAYRRSLATTATAEPAVPTWAIDVLTLLRVQAEAIARIERRLETGGKGPRDANDVALILALARSGGSRELTATGLLAHAKLVSPDDLMAALEAADLTTGPDLGEWFKRMRDVPTYGFVLSRRRRSRQGRIWQLLPA